MDDFKTVRLKRRTLSRFKNFSRKVGNSYSNTLEMVMNFFEWHGFLPSERFEKSVGQELLRNRKRTEAAIAIIKNIEKHQTLPTRSMLDTLFQEMSKVETEEEEEFDFKTPEPFNREDELRHYRERYEQMQEQTVNLGSLITELSGKMTYVKVTFGKGHFKLNMDKDEFEKLKKELQDVYHHHRPED